MIKLTDEECFWYRAFLNNVIRVCMDTPCIYLRYMHVAVPGDLGLS